MANIIQLRRSSAASVPLDGTLAVGELAYSFVSSSNSLFIGDASGNPKRIGGTKYLWLHQADTATPGALTANAVVITNGNSHVTEWKTNKLVVGADGTTINVTSISTTANTTQLGANAGGANNELATTYAIKTWVDGVVASNIPRIPNQTIGFGNSTSYITSTSQFVYDAITDTMSIGANVVLNTSRITVGNSTVNTFITSTAVDTRGTLNVLGAATLSNTIAVTGAATLSNTVAVTGNATFSNTVAVTGNATFSNTVLIVGETTHSANVNVTGSANVSTAFNIGANVNLNTTQINVGNSTVNSVITSTLIKTEGALNVTGAATLSNTIAVTGAATFGNTISVTNTASFSNTITVTGAATFSNTISVTNVASFSNNVTITGSLTSAVNIAASGDVTIGGNLAVSGTLTTINTTNLSVSDPLIRIANGNVITDTVDVGWIGSFGNSSVTHYTGLFRDQSDSAMYKLFTGAIPEPGTTVNTANLSFGYASLTLNDLFASSINTSNAQITGGAITGITDLTVADGGTGRSTLATNGILYGQAGSALNVTAAGTHGQVLQADATGIPLFAVLDGGTF